MKFVWLIWTTFGVMNLGVYGLAQDKATDNMQAAREKLQADKRLFVTEHMKLTDSESKVFWPVYDSYQKEMGTVNDRLAKLIQDYASH